MGHIQSVFAQSQTAAPFTNPCQSDLSLLAQGGRHRRVGAGEALWFAGERASHFAVLESGVVQVRRMTPTGEGIVIGLFRSGEAIGLTAALEDVAYPADAVAVGGPVDVVAIRADTLRQSLRSSIDVAHAVNRALLQHGAALRAKIDIVSAGSVPRRLAALMHYLIERFGRETESGSILVDVHLAREDIAQLVSARVETVIRILSRWQKAGWITPRAGGIDIQRVDMLRRIIDT